MLIEADLVERVAAGDLVSRRVDVRADVVQHPVRRHRVAVLLDLRDRLEGGVRQAREDGHAVPEGVRQVEDAHDAECRSGQQGEDARRRAV
jgi:hypothetical protein